MKLRLAQSQAPQLITEEPQELSLPNLTCRLSSGVLHIYVVNKALLGP